MENRAKIERERTIQQHQEEEERWLQEALEQVRETVRREEEELLAKEAAEMEMFAKEQQNGVERRFRSLRNDLYAIHERQEKEIKARHARQAKAEAFLKAAVHDVSQAPQKIARIRDFAKGIRSSIEAKYHCQRLESESETLGLIQDMARPHAPNDPMLPKEARIRRLEALHQEREKFDREREKSLAATDEREAEEIKKVERAATELKGKIQKYRMQKTPA